MSVGDPRLIATTSPAGLAWFATNPDVRGEGKPVRTGFTCPPHIALINLALLDVAAGDCPGLILNVPPRHGKSTLTSQFFPAWLIGRLKKRVLLASYEATFASGWGQKARDVMTQFGRELFAARVREDQSAANNWRIEGEIESGMATAGVGGPLTGKGADILIIDDPIKNAEEAKSALKRRQVWEWYTSTARTRLEPGGAVVVVLTRWHEDDLAGRLIQEMEDGGEYFRVISLPALAVEGDPLGREPGTPLWEDRYGLDALADLKRTLGPYYWSALYQQSPKKESGNIFLGKWFGSWDTLPEKCDWKIIILDTAFKDKQENDFSAALVMSLRGGRMYLESGWRDRVRYPALKKKVKDLYETHRPNEVIIEDKASGQSLIQDLEADKELPFPVIPIKAETDKVSRAHGVSGLCEAGQVLFPNVSGEWFDQFYDELERFPRSENDDYVDCFVHGLTRLRDKAYHPAIATPADESREKVMQSYHAERRRFGSWRNR